MRQASHLRPSHSRLPRWLPILVILVVAMTLGIMLEDEPSVR